MHVGRRGRRKQKLKIKMGERKEKREKGWQIGRKDAVRICQGEDRIIDTIGDSGHVRLNGYRYQLYNVSIYPIWGRYTWNFNERTSCT